MKYILSAVSLLFGAVILCDPAAVGDAVRDAVFSCLEVIIPSLFAFTVLAVYLQQSGLYRVAFRPLTLPLSKLLRLDEELCAVFLLGNLGGYPVGAKLLTQLVRENRISPRDAGRMLCCCYGSGPSFIISIAGMGVFGSAAAGAVLFGACFLSSLTTAVFICRRGERIKLSPAVSESRSSAGDLVEAVMTAARVMFTVCAAIAGFSAVSAVLDILGISGAVSAILSTAGAEANSDTILPALLEISRTGGILFSGGYIFPLTATLLSLGGVCVLMQIAAITAGAIPLKGFLLSRIPAAISSAGYSCIGMLLPIASIEAYAPNTVTAQTFSVNAGMSACVLIMCGILLCTAGKASPARDGQRKPSHPIK